MTTDHPEGDPVKKARVALTTRKSNLTKLYNNRVQKAAGKYGKLIDIDTKGYDNETIARQLRLKSVREHESKLVTLGKEIEDIIKITELEDAKAKELPTEFTDDKISKELEDSWKRYWDTQEVDQKLEKLEDMKYEVNECIERLKSEEEYIQQTPSSGGTNTPILQALNTTNNTVPHTQTQYSKIQEIKLPKFSGDYEKFKSFWEMFTALVDANTDFTDTEKIVQLYNCCKKEARNTIEHISLVGNNYAAMKKVLQDEYDNEYHRQSVLAARFDAITPAQEELQDCKRVYNSIQGILASSTGTGNSMTNFESGRTIREIKMKFPHWVQVKVAKEEYNAITKNKTWKVEDLMKTIQETLKRQAIINLTSEQDTSVNVMPVKDLLVEDYEGFHNCVFCMKTNHSPEKCHKIPDIGHRRDKVKTLGLCYMCLSKDHGARDCRMPRCRYCNHKHHRALCVKYGAQYQSRGRSRQRRQANNTNSGSRQSSTSVYSTDSSRSPSFRSGSSSWDSSRSSSRSRSSHKHKNDRHDKKRNKRIKSPYGEKFRSSTKKEHRISFEQDGSNQEQSTRQSVVATNDTKMKSCLKQEHTSKNHAKSDESDTEIIRQTSVGRGSTNLMTTFAVILNEVSQKSEKVAIMFDTGAQRSFIKEEVAQKLNMKPVRHETFEFILFGNVPSKPERKGVYKTTIMDLTGNSEQSVQLVAAAEITKPYTTITLTHSDKSFMQKYNIEFNTPQNTVVSPDILIGMDYFWKFMNQPSTVLLPSGLVAMDSILGTIISGKEDMTTGINMVQMHSQITPILILNESKNESHETLNSQSMTIPTWDDLEVMGIKDSEYRDEEDEEQRKFIEEFMNSAQIIDGKIHTKFFYNDKIDGMQDNYYVALRRLENVYKSMQGNQELWDKYNQYFVKLENQGILEEVSKDIHDGPYVYYMPHHGVCTPHKATTKLRVVNDASSHYKGTPSLNTCMHLPKAIIPDLGGMLIRWRTFDQVLIADVEAAFLNVKIYKEYRDVTRVIWLKDHKLPPTPDNIRILRHTAVPFGIGISPWLLACAIKFGIKNIQENIRSTIEDNTYVDNLVMGYKNDNDGTELYKVTKKLFADMGFNLREYKSNNKTVENTFDKKDVAEADTLKVLGVQWDTTTDMIHYDSKMKEIDEKTTMTRRTVLKELHSLFDPMGFFGPLMVNAKTFYQKLWQTTSDWDKGLSQVEKETWNQIKKDIQGCHIELPRVIIPRYKDCTLELAVFVDASKDMAAAVVYALVTDSQGKKECNFVMAKQRIAKKQRMTLPRFELVSNVLGVNLVNFIATQVQHKIQAIHLFSDSTIALQQVVNDNTNTRFIRNRRDQIHKIVAQLIEDHDTSFSFYHVASEENAADCSTRGVNSQDFMKQNWIHGPSWLKQLNKLENLKFVKKYKTFKTEQAPGQDNPRHNDFNQVYSTSVQENTRLFHPERFSSFNKYINSVKTVLKFLKIKIYDKLSTKMQEKMQRAIKGIESVSTTTNHHEYHVVALNMAVKDYQNQAFVNENMKQYSNLQLMKDQNGIIRCRGRLGNTEDTENTRFFFISKYITEE